MISDYKWVSGKCVTLVALVVGANIAVLWVLHRIWTPSISVTSPLDPPDVILPLPPSSSPFGVYSRAATVGTGGPCSGFGRDILARGGSAVDAIITIMLCEGVGRFEAMGIGGGFLMTIYNRPEGKMYSLVARETAPAAANQTMFKENPSLSTFGPLAAGIPGELKGFQEAHKRFGRLPWRDLFQPTIKMCQDGVPITEKLAELFTRVKNDIDNSPPFKATILNSTGGRLPRAGEVLKFPRLAQTLQVIADSPNKADELYHGSLTSQFVKDIQAEGGIITEQDMNNYKVRWEEPVNASLSGGFTLYSSPLPGSGILVAFMMRLLDGLLQFADSDLRRSQLMIEAFKHAYGRRTYLGDPHFVDPNILNNSTTSFKWWYATKTPKHSLRREEIVLCKDSKNFTKIFSNLSLEVMFNLTDEETIKDLRSKMFYNKTSQDVGYYGGDYYQDEHGTNNMAVVSPDGSAVVVTSTINTWFGSKFVSLSTGILLNANMDDFSTPGLVNSWGVAPSEANFIQPGKRPQSSISPTIVLDQGGDVRLVVGAAGATTIATQVVSVAIKNLWFGKNIKEAIDSYRFHHQLIPMEVSYEYGVPANMVADWQKIGHKTRRKTKYEYPLGVVTGIARLGPNLTANADWRRSGGLPAGF